MSNDAGDEDFSSLPISERLVHKSWKARQSAYDDLSNLFRTLDPDNDAEYRKHWETLKKMMTDANLVAHESGVSAVLSFIENSPNAAKVRSVIAPLAVEKCLGSNRSGTKAKGLDVLLMFIEVENKGDGVIENILPALEHKTPKTAASAVIALKESLRLFGSKVINVKPIIKQLSKLFDHKDKSVRSEATALAVELYRWLGPALTPSLQELKPVQLKELNDLFESLPSQRAVPERLVRAEQAKREAPGYVAPTEDNMGGGDAAAAEPEPVDPFDLADPVNVLDKLPSNFYDQLASTKWKDRKEILEALLALVKFPKLEEGRYGELLNVLSKRVNDANVIVLTLAINCIEHIANGLRSSFSQYRGIVLSALLEKLKEKKQSVIDALRLALDAVFTCITFADITEDLVAAANHKNPQARSEALLWLARCFRTTRKAPGKPEVKAFAETLIKSLDDGDNTVRDAAAEALGTLMKLAGERALAAQLEKLDKSKESKVREWFDKAEVKVGANAGKKATQGASSSTPAASMKPGKSSAAQKENQPPREAGASAKSFNSLDARKSTIPPKKPSAQPSTKSAPAGEKKKAAASGNAESATVKEETLIRLKYSDETAVPWVQDHFSEINIAELGDSNWKVRLAAGHALFEAIKTKDPADVEAEAVVLTLSKTPGWKDSNFQVMNVCINILAVVSKFSSFSKAAAQVIVAPLTDKLGDMKLKRVAGDCLSSIAESASLNFVLSEMYEPLRKAKSPKLLSDSILWIHQTLMEFGTKGVSVRDLVDFVKSTALPNTNAVVRTAGVVLLGVIRMFMGPEVRALVTDLNPQQLALVDAEFDKVADKAPPAITKVQSVATAVGNDSTEELVPRVDISGQITTALLDKLADAQWKTRKEGLDDVAAILEAANKKIKPNLGELVPALKARLVDSNKNLAMNAVEICGTLAVSVGKPFDKSSRTLLPSMSGLLADQKVHVRSAAMAALEQVYTAVGLEPFIISATTSLAIDNPQLRKDLLKFLAEKMELTKQSSGMPNVDMGQLVPPILSCLLDKNSDVRKNASLVLAFVADECSLDFIRERAGDLYKGSQLSSLTPYFEALRSKRHVASAISASKSAPSPLKKRQTISGPISVPTEAPSGMPTLGGKARPGTVSGIPSAAKSKRPVSMLPTSMSMKPEFGDSGVATEPAENLFPLNSSDMRPKDQRAGQDRGLARWAYEGVAPRKELVEFLQEQCREAMSPGLIALMFSTDHYKEKDFLSAITMLDDAVMSAMSGDESDLKRRFIANLDLILKYLTIRFSDTNTSMLIKCLELLEHLFNLLDEQGYMLSDYEATSFLPFFIAKVGDNKETMRARIRSIMRQISRVYPASKLFAFILDSLKSKNARTRSECLEELGDLIKRNGIAVCGSGNAGPAKALPVIASQISDADAKVRNAALNAIVQAYLLVGEGVYKLVGRISEKDKSMLEEKVKRLPVSQVKEPPPEEEPPQRFVHPAKVAAQAASTSAQPAGMVGVPGVRKEFSLDFEKIRMGTKLAPKTEVAVETPNFEPAQYTSLLMDFIVAQITSTDSDQSLDALRRFEGMLLAFNSNEEVDPKFLHHLNDAINAITVRMKIAFMNDFIHFGDGQNGKLCRHLIGSLVQVFSLLSLAKEISADTLSVCIRELLNRLLDPRIAGETGYPQQCKALNVLMVRILENADKDNLFRVLLSLLEESASATVSCPSEEVAARAKNTELVMKCLWKMTKVLPQLIEQDGIDVARLIESVHLFLRVTPPSEWKRRAAEKTIPQADMPLRTVKTILHEIVNVIGERVMEGGIALIDDVGRSHAVLYLRQMLEQERRKNATAGVDTVGSSPSPPNTVGALADDEEARASPPRNVMSAWANRPQPPAAPKPANVATTGEERGDMEDEVSAPVSSGPKQVPPINEFEADERLTVIFARIGQKDETKQGIADLHEFRKMYPDKEPIVQEHLGRTGNYFQGYIRRGLQGLETAEKEKEHEVMMKRASASVHSMPDLRTIGNSSASNGSASGGWVSGDLSSLKSEMRQSMYAGLPAPSKALATSGGSDTVDMFKESLARLQQKLGSINNNSNGTSSSALAGTSSNGSNGREVEQLKAATSDTAIPSPQRWSLPPHARSGGSMIPSSSSSSTSSLADRLAMNRPLAGNASSVPLMEKGTAPALAPVQRSQPQTVEQLKQRLAAMKMQQKASEN